MKTLFSIIFSLLFFPALTAQNDQSLKVKKILKNLVDWQIVNYNNLEFRTQNKRLNIGKYHSLDWSNRALYVGMPEWEAIANINKYYEWLKGIREAHDWKLHMREGNYRRIYQADYHTVGQTYFHLYRKYKDEEMIKPTINQFDFILYHPSKSKLDWQSTFHQDRLNWCDALFMLPPVWVMASNYTKHIKYTEFMV
tara:strand:- start:720 stop:1307 length:588 start_codon:yes stop_codon:yes gene_type:complete